jgi:hypothetical protein
MWRDTVAGLSGDQDAWVEKRPTWWSWSEPAWHAWRRCGPSSVLFGLCVVPLALVNLIASSDPPPLVDLVATGAAIGAISMLVTMTTTALWAWPKALIDSRLRNEPGYFVERDRERATNRPAPHEPADKADGEND